jgi:hypothetical protein
VAPLAPTASTAMNTSPPGPGTGAPASATAPVSAHASVIGREPLVSRVHRGGTELVPGQRQLGEHHHPGPGPADGVRVRPRVGRHVMAYAKRLGHSHGQGSGHGSPQLRMGERQMVGVSLAGEALKPTPVRVLPETVSAVISWMPWPPRPVTEGELAFQLRPSVEVQMTTS